MLFLRRRVTTARQRHSKITEDRRDFIEEGEERQRRKYFLAVPTIELLLQGDKRRNREGDICSLDVNERAEWPLSYILYDTRRRIWGYIAT
jgi:hypothetical protein